MTTSTNQPPRVLVVDDDDKARAFVARSLVRCGFEASESEGGTHAMAVLERGRYDAVVCDLHMPEVDGLDVLRFCSGLTPRPVFVMLTAHGSVGVAVEAMKHGAVDFLVKPASIQELDAALRVALGTKAEKKPRARAAATPPGLVGGKKWLEPFRKLLAKVATTDAIVLIEGETGTGKSAVARELWQLSSRSDGPFLELNCAAIAKDLMENELFGNVKGAFTGAIGQAGKVEKANGGTLFLDEIGELHLDLQAKLLHLLQEKQYTPVGGTTSRNANVRFVAATNRNLELEVKAGRFRSDLFFRLDVVKLTIPPLRDRRDDIVLLLNHFRMKSIAEHGRCPTFVENTIQTLTRYDWPGNVRELENLVARLSVMLEPEEEALEHHLPDRIRNATGEAIPSVPQDTHAGEENAHRPDGTEQITLTQMAAPRFEDLKKDGLALAVKQYESDLIRKALEESEDNVTQAAKLLGMKRTTLIEKRRRYEEMGLLFMTPRNP